MYGNQNPLGTNTDNAYIPAHELDSYSKSLELLQSLSNFDPTKPSEDETQATSNNHLVNIINPSETSSVQDIEKITQPYSQGRPGSIISIPSEERSPPSSINCLDFSPARSTVSSKSPSQSILAEILELGSRQLSADPALEENKGLQTSQLEERKSSCQLGDQILQSREPESDYQSQNKINQSKEPESGPQSEDRSTPEGEPESREPESGCQTENLTSDHDNESNSEISEGEEDLLDRELEIWGPPEDDEIGRKDVDEANTRVTIPPREEINSEARLAGVLPMAALFRRPSAASKKYTRKPISKLFISLDLTAEAFITLQAAAKSYMLDERYPERREAIGNKRRAENDMGRLKLYCYVKHFLEEEGWGERCFGSESERVYEGRYKWPESKKKIIQLVTPLMRRMVTNERQRQYAIKTRMGKRQLRNSQDHDQGNGLANLPVPTSSEAIDISPNPFQNQFSLVSRPLPIIPDQFLGATSGHGGVSSEASIMPNAPASLNLMTRGNKGAETNQGRELSRPEENILKFHMNILQAGRRLKKITLLSCPTLSSLVRHTVEVLKYPQEKVGNIQVLAPCGLVPVFDEESWKNAIALINNNEWMDNEIRCLINIETSEVINLDPVSPFNIDTLVTADLESIN